MRIPSIAKPLAPLRTVVVTAGFLALALLAPGRAIGQTATAPQPSVSEEAWQREYGSTHDRRMQWWREARFGMFIHWGVYSVPGGVWKGDQSKHIAEWLMLDYKIPVAEYDALAGDFNPMAFDAPEWVRLAKAAGMKYIVITSKHHDGFAMFHSQASSYNIFDATPFKRDPLRELAEACRKEGVRLGFYYSQAQDWHHPGGAAAKGGSWDPAQSGSMDDYIDKVAVPQVKEILSNYGRVSVLWWDTPVNMTPERVARFLPLLKLQPGIVTNNRLDKDKRSGDFSTPEQKIPATGIPGKDWETCMTMNTSWGYKSFDDRWKSTETLIRNLVDIASKGGNYLLNVGPTSEGRFPEPSVERLREIGKWMKVNGEAIYGTTASPFPHLVWGRCTSKIGSNRATLYLHVLDWPSDGKLLVPGLVSEVKSATLLAGKQKLTTSRTSDGWLVLVPPQAPDPISSTVVLKVKGPVIVR